MNFNLSLLDAPLISGFQGREDELGQLRECVGDVPVAALVAMGGMGKSWAARAFVEAVGDEFDAIVWVSVLNAQPWTDTVRTILRMIEPAVTLDVVDPREALDVLYRVLARHRHLIVLDNLESVMAGGGDARGDFRPDHHGYSDLIRVLAMCGDGLTILTTRERPRIVADLGEAARTVVLGGLGVIEAKSLAARLQLQGEAEHWHRLVELYDGNPQLIKLAFGSVAALGGDLAVFLEKRTGRLAGERALFDWHFERLSPREQSVLFWLAVMRTPVPIGTLTAQMYPALGPVEPSSLELLATLRDRDIVEWYAPDLLALQPALLEYVTSRLVGRMIADATNEFTDLDSTIVQQPIFIATASTAVRSSLQQLLVAPIVQGLVTEIGSELLAAAHLRKQIAGFKDMPAVRRSYAAGNACNLLISLAGRLDALDLSGLTVRFADLSDTTLHGSSVADAELVGCDTAHTFGNILTVSSSPDGALFAAAGTDTDVRVWKAAGEPVELLAGHTNWIRSLAFDDTSRYLASGSSDGAVRIWDLVGHEHRCIDAHEMRIWAVTWLGDRVITASQDQTIKVWDAHGGTLQQVLRGHAARVLALAVGPSGMLLSGGSDGTIRVWSVDSPEPLAVLELGSEIASIAVGSRLAAAASTDGRIWMLDLSDRDLRTDSVLTPEGSAVNAVRFSPGEERLVSAHDDGFIRVWDVATGTLLTTLIGHGSRVTSIEFLDSGTLLSGGEDQTVRRWDAQRWQLQDVLIGKANHTWSVSFADDRVRTLISAHEDCSLRLWSPGPDGRWAIRRTLTGHGNRIWSVRAARGAAFAVSASEDGHARVWDLERGECFAETGDHHAAVWSADFVGDDGRFATGDEKGRLRIWSSASSHPLLELNAHSSRIRAVVGHPQQAIVSSGGEDFAVRTWDAVTGELVAELCGHTERVNALGYGGDGDLLASGGHDGMVVVWDTRTSAKRWQCDAGQYVWAVALSPDGRCVAFGTENGDVTVRVLDSDPDGPTAILTTHPRRVKSLAFSLDGEELASCGEDGTIHLTNLATGVVQEGLRAPRPYEGLDITNLRVQTEAAVATLRALGAIERPRLQEPIAASADGTVEKEGRVFISYAREDVDYVSRLVEHLIHHGVQVWFDRTDIDHGNAFSPAIQAALDQCAAVVPIMSPRSRESRWVRREIQYAESLEKPILPLLLSGTVFFQLADLNYEDVQDESMPGSQFVRTLAQALSSVT